MYLVAVMDWHSRQDARLLVSKAIGAASTIKRHWNGVRRWFQAGINNGILEGIIRLIQAANARTRGYRIAIVAFQIVFFVLDSKFIKGLLNTIFISKQPF